VIDQVLESFSLLVEYAGSTAYDKDMHVYRQRQKLTKHYSEYWKYLTEAYGEKCAKCNATDSLCIDHVHAVADGGMTELHNLQILCRSCNSSKGVKRQDYR
jgi:5-methylcytosine-specific restriction endonuclease McrA